MKALVLAAGLGSRLRPLTERLPKPLVPLFGRPCVEHLLRKLSAAGIRDVAINTHWLPDVLQQALGDGTHWGLRLHWQHEPELLEGAGTLKSFEWLFGDEPVVCLNGDVLWDGNVGAVVAAHRSGGAELTLVTTPVPGPLSRAVAWDAAGSLVAIRRMAAAGPAWIGDFAGVMVAEPRVWREWVPPGVPYHLTVDLCPRLLAAGVPVHCHLDQSAWADIGSREGLDRAHALALLRRATGYLDDAVETAPGVWCGPAALVGTRLRRVRWLTRSHRMPDGHAGVYLGAGSRVEAGATLGPYAALGPGAVLRPGESLAYGVRLDNDLERSP
ncbi:MAG: NDP-sugar synthase [Armatimonadetes bacterium]|nr:NDP-sugar synthase [Armatimonadota bacterium]